VIDKQIFIPLVCDMIRVSVFDDNKNRRESLKMLIEDSEGMACVGIYPNCSDLIQNLNKSETDVVLMDIDMPIVNGIEGVKLIRSHFPAVHVLMQTVFEDDDKIFASICAGANGYLLKKAPPEKIIAAIRDVKSGDAPMTASVARKVLEMFQKQSPQDMNQMFDLTTREKEILSYLVKGMSYKMIADACGISYNTVSTHIRKIYEKLHVHSATEAISKALSQKIV
jgi:DNA-binding NarL/FixJ family response regulator